MEKVPRKELMQLCTDHKIRTAGVKQDELIRLLQKKLQSPASTPPRMPKARSQMSSIESPPMSPKPKTHSRTSSTESLPTSPQPKVRSQLGVDPHTPPKDPRGKLAEKSSGTRSTGLGRSDRSLLDNPSRRNSSEQIRKEPSSDSGLPRKPTSTKTASTPAQKSPSDLLRKKASTSSVIGKLAQDRHSKPTDESSSRSRHVSFSEIGKPAQERRPRQGDGSSLRTRNNIEGPRQSARGTSLAGKRPGERSLGLSKINEARKPRTNADAYSEAATSPRASEAGDCASVIDNSDLCSVYSFCSVSEVATDAGQHNVEEDFDVDDGRSVSSEPASSFALRANRLTLRTSTLGSKMDQSVCSSWQTAHGRDFLDSSVKSSALNREGLKLTELAKDREDEFFHNLKDTDSLTRDATIPDTLLDSLAENPGKIIRAEGQKEEFEKLCMPDSSTTCSKENEIAASEGTKREHLHSSTSEKNEAALAAGPSASESEGNLSTEREISPPSKVEAITHKTEAAIKAGHSASKSGGNSSMEPAPGIAEIIQTSEAAIAARLPLSKSGVDLSMRREMLPPPGIETTTHTSETAIAADPSASESGGNLSMEREISPAPGISETIQTSEAAIAAGLSASESGNNLFKEREMSPSLESAAVVQTSEAALAPKTNNVDLASPSKVSDSFVATMDCQHEKNTEQNSNTVHSDVTCDEFNSDHPKVEHAVACTSTQERYTAPVVEKDAPVANPEHDYKTTVSLGIPQQHTEVTHPAAHVRPVIFVSQTLPATGEKALFDADCHKFDPGHQSIEQVIRDSNIYEVGNNTVLAPCALVANFESQDATSAPFGVYRQEIEMATCEVQHRNTDSFQVDFKFIGEQNFEKGSLIDCAMKLQRDRSFDDQEIGIFQAREEKDVRLNDLGECSISSAIRDEAPHSVVPHRKTDPSTTDRLGKDDSYGVAVVSVGKRSFTEYEPLLQPDILDTTSIAPVHVNLPESHIKPISFDSTIGYDPPEPQIMSFTTRSPDNEREDSDIKMRDGPCARDCGQLPDFNKDGRELKVNLLQDKRENIYQRLDIIQGHWCLAFFKAKILKTILVSGRT